MLFPRLLISLFLHLNSTESENSRLSEIYQEVGYNRYTHSEQAGGFREYRQIPTGLPLFRSEDIWRRDIQAVAESTGCGSSGISPSKNSCSSYYD